MNILKEDKLRIGIFTDTYTPQVNGVVEHIKATTEHFRKKGHTVEIYAPKFKEYKNSETDVFRLRSIKILKNPEQRFGAPLTFSDFLKLWRTKYDVIHLQGGGSIAFLGYVLGKTKGIPVVFTYYTLWTEYVHYFHGKIIKPGVIKKISGISGNMLDAVIAPSQRIKRELLNYGVKKPIHVIPGGIDISRFDINSKNYFHRNFNVGLDMKILLYVGRLGKEKNLEFLIDVFSNIHKKNKKTVLVLAGDGPQRKILQSRVKKLRLSSWVLFTGFIPSGEIPHLYAGSDIFVFSSLSEAQGLVLGEALASGIPIVALDDPAVKESILDGETGFIVKTKEDFSKYVLVLLENIRLRKKMSRNARKYAQNKLSLERKTEELERLYIQLISQKKNIQ